MGTRFLQLQVAIRARYFDFMGTDHAVANPKLAINMLEELCSLSENLDVYLDKEIICKPTIEFIGFTTEPENAKLWATSITNMFADYPIIEFACEVPEKIVRWSYPDETSGGRGLIEKALSMSAELKQQVLNILVCANLSCVGSVQIASSRLLEDGVQEENDVSLPFTDAAFLHGASSLAQKHNWPELHTLEFTKVWKWTNKHQGFIQGVSGTRTERALCAFSRLFHSSGYDHGQELMWSLIGIEALYGKGRESIIEQVREKTQLFLGNQTAFKKAINEMYDTRSRFIHGDLDFPSLAFSVDANDNFNRIGEYSHKPYSAVSMATAILVATLQELIIRDWSGLDFAYSVSDSE